MDPYVFDDGSTLFQAPDGTFLTTPSTAAEMVQGGDTGFFGILDSFAGAITKTGQTIVTLQGQANAIQTAQQRNELERYRTLALLSVGKSQADVATINAQRDVALAKSGLASITGGGGWLPLLAIAGIGYAVMKAG